MGDVGEQGDVRRHLVDQAGFRRPFLIAAVGIDVKRSAFTGVLGVVLVAHASDRDPVVSQVQRVLHVCGIALLLDTLIAVGGGDGITGVEGAVDRMIDVKAFHVLAAQHIGAQQIVILIGDAGQQFVIKTAYHHVALQVGAGGVHLLR